MKKLLSILLIIFPVITFSQIPKERVYSYWKHAGATTSFQNAKQIDFEKYLQANKNVNLALRMIFLEYKNQKIVINFPKDKEYTFTQPIKLASNVKLQANGANFKFDFGGKGGQCIIIQGKAPTKFYPLHKVPKKGDDRLQFLMAPKKQSNYIELRQKNGSWDTHSASWTEYAVGQMIQLIDKNGRYVKTNERISIDYNKTLEPEAGFYEPIQNIEINNLHIERVSYPTVTSKFACSFYIAYARNVKLNNVKSTKSCGAHVFVAKGAYISILNSDFRYAFKHNGKGTQGYGVCLSDHTNYTLVQNNIFYDLRHSMMVKQGANLNVFGYNYSAYCHRSEWPHGTSGDISLHGHYPFANLFEGNVVENMIADAYWGRNGPHNAFLRNRMTNYGFYFLWGSANNQTIVANEATSKNWLKANFYLNGKKHFDLGNANDAKECKTILEKSLYLKKQDFPQFFIGEQKNFGKHKISAQLRYEATK